MDLPLHPKIVHLPIALAVLMPLLTSGLLLAIWRDWLPKRAWLVAGIGQLLLVGSGWLALRSGEADEHRVERLVPEAVLEQHEEAGERFVWGAAFVLALVGLPLLMGGRRPLRATLGLATVGTLGVLYLGYDVGQRGGELVYGHLVGDAPASASAVDAPPFAKLRHDDDDDR